MLTQSTIGDSGVGDPRGSVHESPTNQAQFNLIYPNQLLGIQVLGIRAVHHGVPLESPIPESLIVDWVSMLYWDMS